MANLNLCCIRHLFTVGIFISATAGLEWAENSVDDGAQLEACLGETVTFPWRFTTSDDETVVNVEWHKTSEGIQTILAIHNDGVFFPSPATNLKLSMILNAGLQVSNFTWTDFGTYRVTVNTLQHGVLKSSSRTAVLSLPDAPVLAGDRLVAQMVPRPVTDKATGEMHVQLTCGNFIRLGTRPPSVVWKIPSGKTVPSTATSNGNFLLTLPNPVEGGTYTCHMEDPSLVRSCLKSSTSLSRLTRGAVVHVDEAQTRLSLLGDQVQGLVSEEKEVSAQFQQEVGHLRETVQTLTSGVSQIGLELEQRKKTENVLMEQVENLNGNGRDVSDKLEQQEASYTRLTSDVAQLTVRLEEMSTSYETLRSEMTKLLGKTGSVYVRWGSASCPDTAQMVYSGVAGGGHYTHKGAAVNALCLPRHPAYDGHAKTNSYTFLYGAEYETHPEQTYDTDVVCAVCLSPRAVNVMIPATNVCHPGWTLEYTGNLMAGHHTHSSSTEYICMDSAMEGDHGSKSDQNGKLFYYVLGECGSLPCPPYIQDKVITCVMCSK